MLYSQKACSTTPVQTATWKPSPTRPPFASAATATLTCSRILSLNISPMVTPAEAVHVKVLAGQHPNSLSHPHVYSKRRMFMESVRLALILVLALAVPLSVCQAQADQGPLERTGRTIKHSAEATGRTLKHDAEATGRTLKHGGEATGRTVGKGVRK